MRYLLSLSLIFFLSLSNLASANNSSENFILNFESSIQISDEQNHLLRQTKFGKIAKGKFTPQKGILQKCRKNGSRCKTDSQCCSDFCFEGKCDEDDW